MDQNRLQPRYTVVELFCGCGGFSHGFHRSNRFDIVLGNDIKKAALNTFRWNHSSNRGEPEVIESDIREVPIAAIVEALERKGIGEHELDVLIGGPPCQGFSQMRRSEERKGSKIVAFKGYNRLDQDPRNDLVLRFLEIAAVLRPKVIVIENVPQMLRHTHNGIQGGISSQIQTMLLNDMGYDVAVRKLNAADYGVPQLRERVFFIASRIGNACFPEPTHADPEQRELFPSTSRAWTTVAEALRDLPDPVVDSRDIMGGGSLDLYPRAELSEFACLMRSSTAFPYNHITRQYKASVLRIIREMQPGETWDAASERMRQQYTPIIAEYATMDEDRDSLLQRLDKENIITAAFFRRYYWSAYTRLSWERPALTITANANFLGSGRFTHPEQQRGITMREAARLQSFDDDFRFITSPNDNESTTKIGIGLDMIGEAVSPLLAEAMARHIATWLDQYTNSQASDKIQLSATQEIQEVGL
jgi:DNA-cytosine methyltransferase